MVKPTNLTCAKKLQEGGCYRWFDAWPLLHKGVSLSEVIDFVMNPIPLPIMYNGDSFRHAIGRRFYSRHPTCHSFALLLLNACSPRQGGPTPDNGGGGFIQSGSSWYPGVGRITHFFRQKKRAIKPVFKKTGYEPVFCQKKNGLPLSWLLGFETKHKLGFSTPLTCIPNYHMGYHGSFQRY